jgi:hypothetical protein
MFDLQAIDPCCLNLGMVKLNHIQSAPSHHEYDPAQRTLRDRIDSPGTRENPRTNATEPFRLYPLPLTTQSQPQRRTKLSQTTKNITPCGEC